MELIVSCLADSAERLERTARAQLPFADRIELRLDELAAVPPERLARLIGALGRPVIAAAHGAEAHGTFPGSDPERLELLERAAQAGAHAIDVPWTLAPRARLPAQAERIVSRHEPEALPEDLARVFDELARAARPGDRLKLVAHARSAEEGLVLLRAVEARARAGRPVCGFASGPAGSFTRQLAPLYGSLATYAAPARGTGGPSAPGQIPCDLLRESWPARGPATWTASAAGGGADSGTEILALVGRPASHSLSPRVHGAALRALAIDATYVACEPESLERFLALLDHRWRALAITMPFKQDAARLAVERDADVEQSGAANTLVRTPRGWRAHNTDVVAVRELAREALAGRGRALESTRALIVGTGGAARAALVALRGAQLFVAGRDRGKSAALAAELGARALPLAECARADANLVVHATPAGSHAAPGELALPREALVRGAVVIDAVYRPLETPLVQLARERGAQPIGGGEWFLRQARAQFELATGRAAPSALDAELEAALCEPEQVEA